MRYGLIALVTAGAAGAWALGGEGLSLTGRPGALPSAQDGSQVADPVAARMRAAEAILRDPARVQEFPYTPYDGRFTFARIYYDEGRRYGGFGRFRGRGEPPWHHDHPYAEQNFTQILQEITLARAYTGGGNILALDDDRLFQFPIAYMSEPGFWTVNEKEAAALRAYLLKGGFIIFDDFQGRHLYNLIEQMKVVMPELDFLPLDGSEAIFDSFFAIDPATLDLPLYGPGGEQPDFWGMFLDNDKGRRMIAIAANNGDLGEYWEYSSTGFYPVDLSNEAYKVGVNYIIYAMTH